MPNGHRTLKELLSGREMTQRQLATALDTTEAQVSNWCRGLLPAKSRQEQMASVLDLTAEELESLGWEVAAGV